MIASNVSVPLLGIVDTAILGHLPDARFLAAVAVGTTIFGFVYWGFGFLRMGTTGLVAQASGRAQALRRGRELRTLLGQSVLLGAAIGVAVWLVHAPIVALGIRAIAPPAEVASEADLYCTIRIASAPAVLATYALIGWLVGMQRTRRVLLVVAGTNSVNIVLDLVLVLGFGMRTAGVAAGTAIAEYVGLGLALALAWPTLRALPGRADRERLRSPAAYRSLAAANRDLFLRTLCLLFSFAFFTAQGARLGEAVVAANAILLNLLMLVSHGLNGFAHACEALTGRAIGARDPGAFRRAVAASARFSLATALVFAATFGLDGDRLIALFTDLDAVASAARAQLAWLAVLPLIAVWCFLLDGVFVGAMRTRAMRDSMVLATCAVYLPVWYLSRGLGNTGLWLAFDAFFLARGVGLGVVYAYLTRHGLWTAGGDAHA